MGGDAINTSEYTDIDDYTDSYHSDLKENMYLNTNIFYQISVHRMLDLKKSVMINMCECNGRLRVSLLRCLRLPLLVISPCAEAANMSSLSGII